VNLKITILKLLQGALSGTSSTILSYDKPNGDGSNLIDSLNKQYRTR